MDVLSIREKLALRALQERGFFSKMSEIEQNAFSSGYLSGTAEAGDLMTRFHRVTSTLAAFVGMLLAGFGFCIVVALPIINQPLRQVMKPWADAQVLSGRPTIIWVQSVAHPALTFVHRLASNTCSVDFYLIFIPFLFWVSPEIHLPQLKVVFH